MERVKRHLRWIGPVLMICGLGLGLGAALLPEVPATGDPVVSVVAMEEVSND